MKSLGRVVAAPLAVLSLLVLALAPLGSPAAAKLAPVLTVTSRTDPTYPRLVTLNGDTQRISFTVTTTEPTTVSIAGSGTGLTVTSETPHAATGTTSIADRGTR